MNDPKHFSPEISPMTSKTIETELDLEGLRKIAQINVRPDYWPDPVAAKEFAEKYPATFLALAGADEGVTPRSIDTAPRDGTMVRLLVDYSGDDADHPLEDDTVAWTVGANNFDNDLIDAWKFAGWCWSHDHFTEGRGKPIGWLPFHGGRA